MEGPSEVIWRNRDTLSGQSLLLVNAPADGLGNRLESLGCSLRYSSQDFAQHRARREHGRPSRFELLPGEDVPGPVSADTLILYLPREKERLHMLTHWIATRMSADARLWVVGENRAGIKSAPRHLSNYFSQVAKLDSARHCSLLEAIGTPMTTPGAVEPFDLKAYLRRWPVAAAGLRFDMLSLPGVFAHGRLDPGTRLLLDSLPALQPEGRVLDFAAGSGVLGIAVGLLRPGCELTLLDVSATALASSRASLELNGLHATLLASDGASELSGRFDWIISNPPFHRGIQQTLDITSKFLAEAGTFLAENGKIVIVCNRHLPYEEWLRRHFRQVKRLAMNNEFTVLQAEQPAQ